jgi:hypothetical protein
VSFYNPNRQGTGARADAHRERIEDDVEGRRLVKEAEREEALRGGKPLRRASLSRVLEALRGHRA